MYVHGRDCRFRPIIVLKCDIIQQLSLTADDMKALVTYFLDYVIRHMLLPGQVENWIVITDLNGLGIMSLPYGVLKEVFAFMQNNFRGRLYKAIVLNAPWTFSAAWKVIENFMEASTASKIVINSGTTDPSLKNLINPSQLEKKFGGDAPNATEYW